MKDDVFFHLEDGRLQLCVPWMCLIFPFQNCRHEACIELKVNGCFAKTVSILRFHYGGAEVLDQELRPWVISP